MTRWSKLVTVAASLGTALFLMAAGAPDDSTSTGDVVVLAMINGVPITSEELDELVIQSHRGMSTGRRAAFDYRKLLDKRINDLLILQQAEGLGLDEEPAVRETVEESRTSDAVKRYVAATYSGPDSISAAAVQEFFHENYWKIQIRQISVRTEESAAELRETIRQGASMDSLAGAISVDTHRYRGGLHNLKVWADVENVFRDAVRDLEVGGLSEPFPYREAWAVVRVEEKVPVDAAELDRYRGEIRKYIGGAERERAWAAFIQDHLDRTPARGDSVVVADIMADSAQTFTPDFVAFSERPVISIGDAHVTEYELRKTISHNAMQSAMASFESHLTSALESEKASLVLKVAAIAAGWYDDEDVVVAYQAKLEETLIDAYLGEAVVSKIRFNRDEFLEYWEEHPEEFRAPPEVQLATIMVGTREEADEIVARLQEGADFGYLRTQYARPGHDAMETEKWVSPGIFSDEIRDELVRLDVGASSGPYEVAGGWFVFKLKNRRLGEVRPLEECELRLREIMFQKKFNALLDEHLALLKERSEIEIDEAAIDEYFGT
jgi:foldase protein PrsA